MLDKEYVLFYKYKNKKIYYQEIMGKISYTNDIKGAKLFNFKDAISMTHKLNKDTEEDWKIAKNNTYC